MNDRQKWTEWIRQLPSWLSATVGLVTAVIGFVILIQSNRYLGLTVSGALVLVALFLSCLYLILAKTPPLIEGGRGVYRYEKLRPWATVAAVLVVIVSVGVVTLEPSRSFVSIALLGTPTLTLTPSPSPSPPPTPTTQPLQGLRVVDVLVFDGDRETVPYVDIKLRNVGSEIAVLKRAQFTMQSADFGLCHTVPPTAGPLLVSWEYDVDIDQATDQPVTMPISQQLGPNEADRFVFRFGVPGEYRYMSYPRFTMHLLNIKIVYDENNKVLDVGDIAFVIAPGGIVPGVFFAIPSDPPFEFEMPECYISQIEKARTFFGADIVESQYVQRLEDHIENLE